MQVNDTRQRVRTLLYNILKREGYETEDNEKKMTNIEIGIFNHTISLTKPKERLWSNTYFKEKYLTKSRTIVANLDPNGYVKNDYLFKKFIVENEFNYKKIIFEMDHMDYFPNRWKGFLEEQQREIELFSKSKDISEIPDGIMKCKKCKSWKTTYTEFQTRSSDEPSTKFGYCYNCFNRWKFF